MATTVQVLCPNGRRQNIKITTNTTLLQVLDDVCKKQGFLPSSDYNLLHGRKILDVSLSFRFSNLPNNVKLDLVRAETSREISNVHVALAVPSGERHEHEFSPCTSLWAILTHWDDKLKRPYESHLARVDTTSSPALHPVCIHLREEVVGEYALQHTTLHHLGLTSGRALIRLTHRPVEESALQQIHDGINQRRKHETQLELKSHQATPSERNVHTSHSVLSRTSKPEHEPVAVVQETTSYMAVDEDEMASHIFGGEKHDSVSTIQDLGNLTAREQEIADRLAHRIMPHIGTSTSTVTSHVSHTNHTFSDFKFPESTKGQDLYVNEMQENDREDFRPCERETIVYNLDAVESSAQVNLPDDFFDVTESDIKFMMDDQRKQIKSMQDQPLMTKTMRQVEQEQKKEKYQFALIRVLFPDKYVLQAKFRKRESVFALYKFVKEHLADVNQEFYLYVTPPKIILRDFTLTMTQANLVPAARIYFGCQEQTDHYLSEAALLRIAAPDVAFSVASLSMTSHEGASATAVASQTSDKRPRKDSGKVVPKWFCSEFSKMLEPQLEDISDCDIADSNLNDPSDLDLSDTDLSDHDSHFSEDGLDLQYEQARRFHDTIKRNHKITSNNISTISTDNIASKLVQIADETTKQLHKYFNWKKGQADSCEIYRDKWTSAKSGRELYYADLLRVARGDKNLDCDVKNRKIRPRSDTRHKFSGRFDRKIGIGPLNELFEVGLKRFISDKNHTNTGKYGGKSSACKYTNEKSCVNHTGNGKHGKSTQGRMYTEADSRISGYTPMYKRKLPKSFWVQPGLDDHWHDKHGVESTKRLEASCMTQNQDWVGCIVQNQPPREETENVANINISFDNDGQRKINRRQSNMANILGGNSGQKHFTGHNKMVGQQKIVAQKAHSEKAIKSRGQSQIISEQIGGHNYGVQTQEFGKQNQLTSISQYKPNQAYTPQTHGAGSNYLAPGQIPHSRTPTQIYSGQKQLYGGHQQNVGHRQTHQGRHSLHFGGQRKVCASDGSSIMFPDFGDLLQSWINPEHI